MDIISDKELNEKIEHVRRLADFVALLDDQNFLLKKQIEALKGKNHNGSINNES